MATATGRTREPDGVSPHADHVPGIGWLATSIASSRIEPEVVNGNPAATSPRVFVFPGHGSQWKPMAAELLESAPTFADQMHSCDAAFAEFIDWSLVEAVLDSVGSPSPGRADREQPVLFAVMVSLAAQWRALGIHPDAVIGHSLGEIAAAYVAGALSLRDAAKVVAFRSTAVSAVIAHRERGDLSATQPPNENALNSAQDDTLLEDMRKQLSGLRPRTADIAFISTVTGAGLDTSILDGEYWFANVCQPVLLDHAVRWAYDHGYRTFIESSPHPVLTASIRELLEKFYVDC